MILGLQVVPFYSYIYLELLTQTVRCAGLPPYWCLPGSGTACFPAWNSLMETEVQFLSPSIPTKPSYLLTIPTHKITLDSFSLQYPTPAHLLPFLLACCSPASSTWWILHWCCHQSLLPSPFIKILPILLGHWEFFQVNLITLLNAPCFCL